MVISRPLAVILAYAMVIVVCVLSLVPLSASTISVQGGDKIGHFFAYFCMSYWFLFLYEKHYLVLVAFTLMGLVIEILQGLSGYRFFEWADLGANISGIILAWLFFKMFSIKLFSISAK